MIEQEHKPWERGHLLDVYKIAVEEYRFQVGLNWNRTQYLFALNAAVLAVGAGLVSLGEDEQHWLVAAVFFVGFVVALHAAAVTFRQHQYYRSARDRMLEIGKGVGLEDMLLQTTPGMSGEGGRWLAKAGRVTWMHYGMFGALALLHLAGAWQSLT